MKHSVGASYVSSSGPPLIGYTNVSPAGRPLGASTREYGHLLVFSHLEDSLAAKCSAMGVPANFSRSRREKSSRELSGRVLATTCSVWPAALRANKTTQ